MDNITDYVKKMGHLPFDQMPFNPVDSLILSKFAYFKLEKLPDTDRREITIAKIAGDFSGAEPGSSTRNYYSGLHGEEKELLLSMGKSQRFGAAVVTDYQSSFDPEEEKQFAAMTFRIGDRDRYAAYRGTDNTIVGWKEDLNMSFMSPVPAQEEAADYLSVISEKYPDGRLWVGGHSKGGNLAVYSAAFAGEEVRNRLTGVFNHDGPGFPSGVIAEDQYQAVLDRIYTYVPQSSVVGMLLEQEGSYTVVKSRQIGLLQHDPFSWEVSGNHFVTLKSVTLESRLLDHTLKDWICSLTPESRKKFIDALYEILSASGAATLKELRENWTQALPRMLLAVNKLDEPTRKEMRNVLEAFLEAAKGSLADLTRAEEKQLVDKAKKDLGREVEEI
ncbi:DUF2974 domain-containing protein [Anaerolentibacter hominis]|uniref:DUF2974 domain-containing protein n=1 Tax=Anaerolentibacter hominis TaxID=3079009 RepID=UPI0031B82C7F